MADIVKKFYEQNKDQDEVKDFKNSLKKFFSDKKCIAIEIENFVQPSSHELKQDLAYKVLVSASVFENYGVMRIADESGKPILQENVSNNYIDFHCDSIDPNTFPYFTAIVSVKSNSKAITRVIEAKEICAKLQKDHPRSMAILTELEFVVQKVTPPSFIELSNPIKIIQLNTDNTYFINYSLLNNSNTTSTFLPVFKDHQKFSRLEITQALKDFKNCLRNSLNYHDFVLNERNQVLLIKNRLSVHNRQQVSPLETRDVVYFVCNNSELIKDQTWHRNKQSNIVVAKPQASVLKKQHKNNLIKD
ncbi:MAG: hypothetical protein ACKO47_04545 [Alphaproteobacteria bacterium]